MNHKDLFAIESFADGGVLLDIEGGTFFQLNAVATLIWEKHLAGLSREEIAVDISRQFQVDADVLYRDIDAALCLPSSAQLRPPDTGCWYEMVNDCYRYSFRGIPVLEVTKQGHEIRRIRGTSSELLVPCLAALSPKLLALRGFSVLHASAVMRPDRGLMIFAGESGAGKTTTGRAFSRQGWTLVSEDKVLLKSEGDRMVAVLCAEPRLLTWIGQIGDRLRATVHETWCEVGALTAAAEGEVHPVREVLLLNRQRRAGVQIEVEHLAPSAAALELFKNAFFGSREADAWRGYLRAIARLARETTVWIATVPNGLAGLDHAARAYTEKVAS